MPRATRQVSAARLSAQVAVPSTVPVGSSIRAIARGAEIGVLATREKASSPGIKSAGQTP
jgi:hypothetical protein